jgi:Holliday junction DNA helicase RuvA
MIASLRGRLAGWDANSVVIDVGGVGYRVTLSSSSIACLGDKGSEVSVLTTMIVREDSMSLYGFLQELEQRLFEKLITVSGIGPKVAMSALSAFDAGLLQQLIVAEDASRIATVPGIGKKTAQRIILELRGVLNDGSIGRPGQDKGMAFGAQATDALLGMGFSAEEADLALKGYQGSANDVAAMLRFALKRLGAS